MDYKEWVCRIAGYYEMESASFNDDEFFFCYPDDKLINFSLMYSDVTDKLMRELIEEYRPDFPADIHTSCVYFMHEIGHIILNTNIDPMIKMILDLNAESDIPGSSRAYMRADGELDPTLWALDEIMDSLDVFREFQTEFTPLLQSV